MKEHGQTSTQWLGSVIFQGLVILPVAISIVSNFEDVGGFSKSLAWIVANWRIIEDFIWSSIFFPIEWAFKLSIPVVLFPSFSLFVIWSFILGVYHFSGFQNLKTIDETFGFTTPSAVRLLTHAVFSFLPVLLYLSIQLGSRFPVVFEIALSAEVLNALLAFGRDFWGQVIAGDDGAIVLFVIFVLFPGAMAVWVALKLAKILTDAGVVGADKKKDSPADLFAAGFLIVALFKTIPLVMFPILTLFLGASEEFMPLLLSLGEMLLVGGLLVPFYLVVRKSALPIAQIAVAVVFIFAVNSVALFFGL